MTYSVRIRANVPSDKCSVSKPKTAIASSDRRIFGIVAIGIAVLLLNAPELRKLGASKESSPTPTADNVLTTLDTTDGQWGLNDAARAAEAERQEAAAGP